MVTCAASLDEAMSILDRGAIFDGAVVDMRLPGGSGLLVINRLLRDQPECRVVASSVCRDLLPKHVKTFDKMLLNTKELLHALRN